MVGFGFIVIGITTRPPVSLPVMISLVVFADDTLTAFDDGEMMNVRPITDTEFAVSASPEKFVTGVDHIPATVVAALKVPYVLSKSVAV